jgi:hypothetical protein
VVAALFNKFCGRKYMVGKGSVELHESLYDMRKHPPAPLSFDDEVETIACNGTERTFGSVLARARKIQSAREP